MDVLSVAGVGKELGIGIRACVCTAREFLQPSLAADSSADSALEVLIDRLCLSLAVAKPVGLRTWAERECRRRPTSDAAEIASAACHAVVTAAQRYEVDQALLLSAVEVLRSEIDRGITSPAEHAERPEAAVVEALLAMLAARDDATCCHSRATGEWARRLAVAMFLRPQDVDFFERCAVLHDIGKVATPDAILQKTGALTESEWVTMRDHSAAGQRILEQIPTLARYAPAVRWHHERYDGTGYPDGLAGIDIPFAARLVAVADAFHAMISARPYRAALPPRSALRILSAGRGTQWDPDVVDAMLGLFTRRGGSEAVSELRVSSA